MANTVKPRVPIIINAIGRDVLHPNEVWKVATNRAVRTLVVLFSLAESSIDELLNALFTIVNEHILSPFMLLVIKRHGHSWSFGRAFLWRQ